jgi:hypothetical protein
MPITRQSRVRETHNRTPQPIKKDEIRFRTTCMDMIHASLKRDRKEAKKETKEQKKIELHNLKSLNINTQAHKMDNDFFKTINELNKIANNRRLIKIRMERIQLDIDNLEHSLRNKQGILYTSMYALTKTQRKEIEQEIQSVHNKNGALKDQLLTFKVIEDYIKTQNNSDTKIQDHQEAQKILKEVECVMLQRNHFILHSGLTVLLQSGHKASDDICKGYYFTLSGINDLLKNSRGNTEAESATAELSKTLEGATASTSKEPDWTVLDKAEKQQRK